MSKLDEELISFYQHKCIQRGLTLKRKHPKRLLFSGTSDQIEKQSDDDVIENVSLPVQPRATEADNEQQQGEHHVRK